MKNKTTVNPISLGTVGMCYAADYGKLEQMIFQDMRRMKESCRYVLPSLERCKTNIESTMMKRLVIDIESLSWSMNLKQLYHTHRRGTPEEIRKLFLALKLDSFEDVIEKAKLTYG